MFVNTMINTNKLTDNTESTFNLFLDTAITTENNPKKYETSNNLVAATATGIAIAIAIDAKKVAAAMLARYLSLSSVLAKTNL
jgi:hypothetical protein